VPKPVVRRAAALLNALEKQSGPRSAGGALGALPLFAAVEPPVREADVPSRDEELRRMLAEIDPDRLTPREALDALYRLKSLVPDPAGEDA
jgi:DNA mismatch repair protein MutS